MRRLSVLLLAAAAGCHTCALDVPSHVESDVIAAAAPPPAPESAPFTAPASPPALPEAPDLPFLWNLTLANNPDLRTAAADVEAARGRWIQAGKYPNPHLVYEHDEIGTSAAPAGSLRVQLTQEVVTAGKRRLDLTLGERETDAKLLALVSRRFDVLTRVRRAYYDYLGWVETTRAHDNVVAALERAAQHTQDVLRAGLGLPADQPRIQALLEEARISQTRSRIQREAAWRLLAAEVGVPDLPLPGPTGTLGEELPRWDLDFITGRVLARHTDLKGAELETERARVEMERARAEAVPNVTVGGGYSWNFPEHDFGGVVSVETALPVWDRKQGRRYEAEARYARAQAGERATATRLRREMTEAFARYESAREQAVKLQTKVLPQLMRSRDSLSQGYQAGSKQLTFADVLLAEQNLSQAQLRLTEARRDLWRAIADLEGLMQIDVGEGLATSCPPGAR
jgi:cobalt-zinc-cadmium efflux system outer membrane protein